MLYIRKDKYFKNDFIHILLFNLIAISFLFLNKLAI